MYGTGNLNSTAPMDQPGATGGDVLTVKITFNDASTMVLKSIMQMGEEFTSASRMTDLINANLLVFDVDGHTMLFPISSIRFIEIHPSLKTPNLLINSSFTLAQ
jgi:hypothetical protein